MIKVIETKYKGYNFRSRLEARWAVFLDALGIKWEYEKEGYVVGNNDRPYLPDFYLPETQTWVEVKGAADQLDYQLMADSVDWNGGLPGTHESDGTTRGLLLLGPLPFVHEAIPGLPFHPILQHHKGGWVNSIVFWNGGFRLYRWPNELFDSTWGYDGLDSVLCSEWVVSISSCFAGRCGYSFPAEEQRHVNFVKRAYTLARSARFEHGQKGGQS